MIQVSTERLDSLHCNENATLSLSAPTEVRDNFCKLRSAPKLPFGIKTTQLIERNAQTVLGSSGPRCNRRADSRNIHRFEFGQKSVSRTSLRCGFSVQIHRQIEMHSISRPPAALNSFLNGFFHWDLLQSCLIKALPEACVVVRLEDTPKAATFTMIIQARKDIIP